MSRRTPHVLQRIPVRERVASDYLRASEVTIGDSDPVKSLERALMWAREDAGRRSADPMGDAIQALRSAADALEAVAKETF